MLNFERLKQLTTDNLTEAKRLLECLINEIEYESDKKDKKEIEKIRKQLG